MNVNVPWHACRHDHVHTSMCPFDRMISSTPTHAHAHLQETRDLSPTLGLCHYGAAATPLHSHEQCMQIQLAACQNGRLAQWPAESSHASRMVCQKGGSGGGGQRGLQLVHGLRDGRKPQAAKVERERRRPARRRHDTRDTERLSSMPDGRDVCKWVCKLQQCRPEHRCFWQLRPLARRRARDTTLIAHSLVTAAAGGAHGPRMATWGLSAATQGAAAAPQLCIRNTREDLRVCRGVAIINRAQGSAAPASAGCGEPGCAAPAV